MDVPRPAKLRQQSVSFDDPDWVFELKHDGFRALAILEHGKTRFISRTGGSIHGFTHLAHEFTRAIRAESAILDGEFAVSHKTGRTLFARLMELRKEFANLLESFTKNLATELSQW